MNAKLFLGGVLIIFKLLLLGCTMGTVDTIESGDRATQKSRVLIAIQKSNFKQAVVQEIRDTLENNSCYIKVVDVKRLPYETTEGYNAIIILNKCMAGRPDPRVESFIDNAPEKEKIYRS